MKALPLLENKLSRFGTEALDQAEIQLKYEVYIEKEQDLVKKMAQLEDMLIPDSFDYDRISSLSNEALQKFKKSQATNIGTSRPNQWCKPQRRSNTYDFHGQVMLITQTAH